GQRLDMNELTQRLALAGYQRTGTVMEPGEYAVRGGILDLFPPGRSNPVRLDFFGDTLEQMKAFDPETQRTGRIVQRLTLMPVSEVAFGATAEKLFRRGYVALFGAAISGDQLYEAVSAGQRYPGVEHWLPLFHERLETLFDYAPEAPLSFDHLAEEAVAERLALIEDHYKARVEGLEALKFGAPPYKPVPPSRLFFTPQEWADTLQGRLVRQLSPFEQAAPVGAAAARSIGGRTGRNFAAERSAENLNLFEVAARHVHTLQGQGKHVIVAAFTPGARERLAALLGDNKLGTARKVDSYAEAVTMPREVTALGVLGVEQGFETPHLAVIGEQDILGDRLVRPRRKARRAADVITEATSLAIGDFVVHADHGIGRFDGLTTITALAAPHDCLEISYAGGDKLYLPVENIELLSRYGAADGLVQLDRLGGAVWQTRKARLKQRLREIAGELIKIAALRQLRQAPAIEPPQRELEEFVARFPYDETEDQAASIHNVLDDLASGKPMDRLVCGDVGFGKTEVALRAAFTVALAGLQVAVVVPTTLLARQHLATFAHRFKGLPVRVAQASRLVVGKELNAVKAGLRDGSIDIVVGTHALLGKSIEFNRLGLVIVDEEQHFGVAHKERLKQMREDVHVLTLTATP
ncbi:MAG: DEAD/DEAH box helicase, partial [Hyphomicrobiaceae bacterium]